MAIVRLDTVRTLGFAAISGSYIAVGTPIQHNWRLVHFINNTDGDVYFSVDGINDNVFVPTGSFVLYDVSTNSSSSVGASDLLFELYTQFYVKEVTATTSGDVYVQGMYARGQ